MRSVPRLLLLVACAVFVAAPSWAQGNDSGGDSGGPVDQSGPAATSAPSQDADSAGRDAAPAKAEDKTAAPGAMGGSDEEKKPAEESADEAQPSMKITVEPAASDSAATPAPAPKPARKPKAKPKKKTKKKTAAVSTPEPGAKKSAPVVAAPAPVPAVPLTPVQPENP